MNSNRSPLDKVDIDPENLPAHVAIIMDGNGRWAKKRFLGRVKGHEKGSETVRSILRTCRKVGITYLTLYAFSTENWNRPQAEVSALMALLKKFLVSERRELAENKVRLSVIGQVEKLPGFVRKELDETMALTRHNDGLYLNLALSYGGRAEIVRMVKKISRESAEGLIHPDAITEGDIHRYLYTRNIPDPDLLIRTGGEMRVSNFLLWQIAYSEIYVTDTLWPDFGSEEFIRIIRDYQQRERRFGRV